ncbi:hypothetical protein F7731_03535 [Cytobacillus depressus]|uniref:Spore coat protein n=1 Tax=Cytobacillus depressus TaxID=1602942 RepID=A0A6L3VDJ8_9BACI|nr:hypothetical protein [Cytobacillus depressus]KAB2338637.1 hypothetical protein F7731_03535 [Cytobacillus depressus]
MSKDMMESLVNKVIKINRGGPESGSGVLIGVKDDYLVLYSQNDGVVYFKNQHIKSLTESSNGKNNNGQNYSLDQLSTLDYVAPDTFEELLEDLRYQWVTINRGGPEKVEGVLHDSNGEFVALFRNEELLRLSMYHIRSISYGVSIEEEENEEEDSY